MSSRMNRVIAKRLFFIFVLGLLILSSNSLARSQSVGQCTAKVFFAPVIIHGGTATGLAFDAQNNLYVANNADSGHNILSDRRPFVTKVTAGGAASVFVERGILGDVTALTVDGAGNLFIADGNGNGNIQPEPKNMVWKVTPQGIISSFITGINNPTGLAFDQAQNLYVASFADKAVYKYSSTGTFLGTVTSDLPQAPYGIAVDSSSNLYVTGFAIAATPASAFGTRIYKITPGGQRSVFVDPGFPDPYSLVFDSQGYLYASYYNSLKILRIATDGSYTVFPGGCSGDDAVNGMAIDSHGRLYGVVNGGRTTDPPSVLKLSGVVPGSEDDSVNTFPQLSSPGNIMVVAKSALGSVVNYSAVGIDQYGLPAPVSCSIPSGSVFPVGVSAVTCTAQDGVGNLSAPQTFSVSVLDTPPVLSLPPFISTFATSASGAHVTYLAVANDAVSGPVPVQCSSASGSIFPIGSTVVNCSATDGAGNIGTGRFVITVSGQSFSGAIATRLTWVDGSENNWIFQQYIAVDSSRHRLYQAGLVQCDDINVGCFNNAAARLAVIDTLTNTLLTEWSLDNFPEGYNFGFNTPQGIAVNPVTNKIYVSLSGGTGSSDWLLAIIDGATGHNRMVVLPQLGEQTAVAVNPLTNMIYLSTAHRILAVNGNDDSISVIDVPSLGPRIQGMAINSKTNKLYLTIPDDQTLAVVNLQSNAISFLLLPDYNGSQFGLTSALAVNEERNEVYFTGRDNFFQFAVAILDGYTNTFTFAPFPDVPRTGDRNQGVIPMVNAATNRVYFGADYFFVMDVITREIAYLPSDQSPNAERCSAVYDPSLNHAYSIAPPDISQQGPDWAVRVVDLGSAGTPTGTNVTVHADLLSLTFANVATGGSTSATPIDPASIGQIPGGFAVSDSIAYEISTTAAFNGPVTIAFKVPGPISEAEFASLSILHNENGTLVDVTATSPARDYPTKTLYATTTSFSPFYLARKGQHIKSLFDQTRAYKRGSTIPIKLQVLNAANNNTSSSNSVLVTRDLRLMSGNTFAPVVDSGNANPDYTFRYDSTLGGTGGGYIFNLSTRGLAAGSYVLSFYVGSDRSFFHTVKFEVK